jgi:uncharacterized protein
MKTTILKALSALVAALMLTFVTPTIKAQETTPEISSWALETLVEGEKYGIFPLEWYTQDFQNEISTERLNTLLKLTEAKIAGLELSKNVEFTPVAVEGDTTRNDIIHRLFNLIAQYDINASSDPIKYLQERNVLRGSQNDLMLNQTATTEQAVIFAIRLIQDIYEQADAGAKGVAWIVEDEDTKIYLLGSIHIGIPDLYPIHKKLKTAFNESDALIVEANLLDPNGSQYYVEKAFYKEGKTLQENISEESYAKLEKVSKQLDIPIESLNTMKPWFISSYLSSLMREGAFGLTADEQSQYGIDMQFTLNAYLQQKPIYELEGIQAQVDMFDSLSREAQEEELVSLLDGILGKDTQHDNELALIADWFKYWKLGDIENFAKSIGTLEGDDEFSKMLNGKRDEDMASIIMQLLENEPGQFFVVVGAAHFLVDKNIRYHLEQNGYNVTPLYE